MFSFGVFGTTRALAPRVFFFEVLGAVEVIVEWRKEGGREGRRQEGSGGEVSTRRRKKLGNLKALAEHGHNDSLANVGRTHVHLCLAAFENIRTGWIAYLQRLKKEHQPKPWTD